VRCEGRGGYKESGVVRRSWWRDGEEEVVEESRFTYTEKKRDVWREYERGTGVPLIRSVLERMSMRWSHDASSCHQSKSPCFLRNESSARESRSRIASGTLGWRAADASWRVVCDWRAHSEAAVAAATSSCLPRQRTRSGGPRVRWVASRHRVEGRASQRARHVSQSGRSNVTQSARHASEAAHASGAGHDGTRRWRLGAVL
jgi:hypothetical protein